MSVYNNNNTENMKTLKDMSVYNNMKIDKNIKGLKTRVFIIIWKKMSAYNNMEKMKTLKDMSIYNNNMEEKIINNIKSLKLDGKTLANLNSTINK